MLPAYLRSDVAYLFFVRKWLRATVGVDNLLGRRNQAYVGFLTPGRRFRLDLSATF